MPEVFTGLSRLEAAAFADLWLPAWTGNDPERLASFYTEDAFYSDPAVPEGLHGRGELVAYFRTLLKRFPDWTWEQRRATPMPDGFLNHWRATIPVASRTLQIDGVCTVALRDSLIYRNEVHFDRTELIAALRPS